MKNEYRITKRLMRSWAKGWWFNSTANTVSLIFFCFYAILFFILPQLFIHYSGCKETLEELYFKIFSTCHTFALLVILCIPLLSLMNSSQYNKQYKTCSKNYCAKKWQRVIEFTEDEIIVDDQYSVSKFEYSTIKRVKEKRKMVIIFLKSGFEIRLYKNAFAEGSWEECKKMISRKSLVNVK